MLNEYGYNKITQDIKNPFKMGGGNRIDDTPVHKAHREALANCLINTDYYGRQGVVVIKRKDDISLSNPGGFRMEIDAAKSGGVSDPRNSAMLKMFNLINIGERAGSGIPNIMSVWSEQKWVEPKITQTFEPERTTLTLSLKAQVTKSDGKKVTAKTIAQKQAIIEYLTNKVSATSQDIADLLNVGLSRAKNLLRELIADDVIVAEGADKNRTYRLKSN